MSVRFLLYRANLLGSMAEQGKFRGGLKPVVMSQVRAVREVSRALDPTYGKRYEVPGKRIIRGVEIISGGGEGREITAIDQGVDNPCIRGLLVEDSGSSGGIPRDCELSDLEGDKGGGEVPGGVAVRELVS